MFGINYYFGYGNDVGQRFAEIKNAGFSSVSINADSVTENLYGGFENLIKLAHKSGLNVPYIHGPYCKEHSIKHLFVPSDKTQEIMEFHKKCILICSKYGVQNYVIHANRNNDNPVLGEFCLNNFRELNDFAKSLNVKLAVENTTSKEVLKYLLQNIQDDNFGLCFDSGHHNVYTKDFDILSFAKDRIFVVHLHDNFGTEDEHNVIGFGNIDWTKLYMNLKQNNFKGVLCTEVKANKWQKETLDCKEYLGLCYRQLQNSLLLIKTQQTTEKPDGKIC